MENWTGKFLNYLINRFNLLKNKIRKYKSSYFKFVPTKINLSKKLKKKNIMYNFGVGGQEVKNDASEGMADIPMNRTLFVQKLTDDEPVKPKAVYDLTNIEQVFEHFKPEVKVDFETVDGTTKNEALRFGNVGDFGAKNITQQSSFLQDLNIQQEQYQKIVKQLKTNKLMKNVIENEELKAAFIDSLKVLIQELDETTK